jgi:hypothetical protein
MQVQLVQTGGYTGLARTASIDLSELPAEQAARARAALSNLTDVSPAPQVPVAGHQPRYQLTISDGPSPRTIVLYETQVPPELRPLLQALLTKANPAT